MPPNSPERPANVHLQMGVSHCDKQLREEITRFMNRFFGIDNGIERTYLDASIW